MLGKTSSLLIFAIAVAGCAARASSPTMPTSRGAGETLIAVEDHLGGPFVLERVEVSLDGAPLGEGAATGASRVLLRRVLATGEHNVTVRARVRTPCGLGSEPNLVHELRGSRSFTVGSDGGAFVVDLFSPGPVLAERGPRLEFRAAGSVREGGRFTYHFPECQGEPVFERATCTADRLALRAREVKDLAWHACVKDKKRALVALREDVSRGARERDRRAADLEIELHECRGLEVEITRPVVATRDACGPVGALP